MSLNLFKSRAASNASSMCGHVRKLLAAQRDILSEQAITAIEGSERALKEALRQKAGDELLKEKMKNVEAAANKWLKPYPNASIRENVEVLLVALAIAMAVRTFFLQPFKIPTGSMQPTLFGVTPEPWPSPGYMPGNEMDLKIPGPARRFWDYWTQGHSYFNIIAPEDGQLQEVKPPQKLLMFNLKQDYVFNNQTYTVWLPADNLFQRAGYVIHDFPRRDGSGLVDESPVIKAGQPIVRLKTTEGDHLFVDRLSYNFRRPKRGEIIVFETKNIPKMAESELGQFYIKRLVGLPNEKVQIGNDRHLIINGVRLTKETPHFENVYSFDPAKPPLASHYSGHVNQFVAEKYFQGTRFGMLADNLAPLFPDQNTIFTVPDGHFIVMGDNTMNSADSRVWDSFPQEDVMGKYFIVYWPFSSRFGWNVK